MADADEDDIPTISTSGADDLEDETQDFRFLTQLTSSSTGQAIIPKRGTKDFEPNPTRSQSSALDASRLAMHTALSAVRVHAGKNHILGQYLPNEEDWRYDNASGLRHGRCVVVPRFKSTHLKVMGVADRHNWTWFTPEEALFLLERGSLDIRWPDVDEDKHVKFEENERGQSDGEQPTTDVQGESSTQGTAGQEEDQPSASKSREEPDMKIGELPMSLQGAYASFIGKDDLTLERYSVYAALKRAGYVVQRAPTWHDLDPPQANGDTHPETQDQSQTPPSTSPSTRTASQSFSSAASIIHRLVSWLFQPRRGQSCPALGPLVAPGLYRNYADIFRSLALIPYHDPSKISTVAPAPAPVPRPSTPQPPFRIHFHVWKPSNAHTYRKTAPPPPDYRIVVVDARTTSMPTLTQIGELLDTQPEDSLSKDKAGRLEARIKHGRRNVLLAIVDMGVVSYLRLSDACFGAEKLFEEKALAGSKGKGRGGGARRAQGQGQGQQKGK